MEYYLLSIGILLFGAFFSFLIKQKHKLKLCSLAVIISSVLNCFIASKVLFSGEIISSYIKFSPLFGNVNFTIDALSSIFIIAISVLSSLGLIYANGYLAPYINKGKSITSHCFFLMLLIASMLSVVTVQNALFFLVVWELMSLSSFFLVIFEGEKKEVLASGIKYLVYMHFSVIFIIAMMVILTNSSMSLDFRSYVEVLKNQPNLANIAFTLGFIGFGIKAGFVPFHNWLPDAHPSAPTHVSGIMSGVMIKTGIYGILRMLLLIGVPSLNLSYFVLVIALITLLYGVLYAITQHDLKRLLAYSSIENIGIICLGIAIGMLGLSYNNTIVAILGFSGSILHIINHSIFKGLLFFSAGAAYLKTHTRNMEYLGGLIKKMPITGTVFILGSVAICGLPPFNGFISEILIYAGMLLGIPSSTIGLFLALVISIASLALIGTMAMLCFTKASGIVFLGEARTDCSKNVDKDVCLSMTVPMILLTLLTLLIGIFPQYALKLIMSLVALFIKDSIYEELFGSIIFYLQNLSVLFIILVSVILISFVVKLIVERKSNTHSTWGCGYKAPNTHMQYTPSSYSNLFVATLKPLFKRVSHIKKPKDLFPKDAYFELEIEDIEEAYIVEPIVRMDEKFLAKFERIQNGNMQQYILFGLIFLVLSIVGLILVG